ncbi:MAG: CHAT domain-containing protein, partial [Anaerolineae bacterium]
MLTVTLSAINGNIHVAVNGQRSHTLAAGDLQPTPAELQTFADDPRPYGQRLYAALFPKDSPAAAALRALPRAPHPDGVLLLEAEPDSLYAVPWEYLCDSRTLLAADYALLRRVKPATPPAGTGETTAPIPLLFVPAAPLLTTRGEPAPYSLAVETEWDALKQAAQATNPPLEVRYLLPPTVARLREEMAGQSGAIVHFTGHGTTDGKTAYLVFEKPSGAADPVEASRVASILRGRTWLLVLSACLSATPGRAPEANLAALLCAQGLPWVLGMQFPVSDRGARTFTDAFYRALFRGESVPEAARQGRLAVLNDPSIPEEMRYLEAGIPVLYTCLADATAIGQRLPPSRGAQITEPPRPRLEGLPVPERGFFGRQRELVEIGEHLTAERPRQGETYPPLTLTLHGTGGIGKTALLRRAAEQFAWNYEQVFAISLDPLPTLADVLSRLEEMLGLPHEGDEEARIRRVTDALTARRTLLVLDNFETLIHARDGADEEQKQRARSVFRFLQPLPARGLTFLASSRERTGLPGERIVTVRGLDEKAGGRFFSSMVSARRSALTEEGVEALSHRLGGHPLALKLLAPVFDEGTWTLQEFANELELLLPQAADPWSDEGRHATLQACFAFSLKPLEQTQPELARALASLSVFTGEFVDILAAPVLFGTEEAEQRIGEAARTLHRLWERGLLEREEVPLSATESRSFYSLHPALRPFAAQQLAERERTAAEAGFFAAMRALGGAAYAKFKEAGLEAQLARRALADLRRAARMRNDAEGSTLRFHTAWFLRVFGDLDEAMRLY